ncbi:hypothetical protein, partial [Actinomyces bovis]
LPFMATELGARDQYGLVTAAAQVPAFLTMPLGGAMLGPGGLPAATGARAVCRCTHDPGPARALGR